MTLDELPADGNVQRDFENYGFALLSQKGGWTVADLGIADNDLAAPLVRLNGVNQQSSTQTSQCPLASQE